MTIFYQHIGREMWLRDGPKSIGHSAGALKRFGVADIEPYLDELDVTELIRLRELDGIAPEGFQIWGIPSGAGRVLEAMQTGDFLMLQESENFRYVGQVLHRISELCPRLSQHIWGEQRFPIIIALQGQMISFPWTDFSKKFGFDPKFHMRGNTMRLSTERIQNSPSGSEDAFITSLVTTAATNPLETQRDFRAFSENLRRHMRMVRERGQQQAFRRDVLKLHGCSCAVCDIALPNVMEAAHIIPKKANGSDDPRNGLALCVLHHRMFDANLFRINPQTHSLQSKVGFTLADLKISRVSVSHIKGRAHSKALVWRWENSSP